MKGVSFIFLFCKFQSLALAKLYHRCVVLSMFYFFISRLAPIKIETTLLWDGFPTPNLSFVGRISESSFLSKQTEYLLDLLPDIG